MQETLREAVRALEVSLVLWWAVCSEVRLSLYFPAPVGKISLCWAAWAYRRGDVGNVNLSLLPFAMHLFLFLCFIHIL